MAKLLKYCLFFIAILYGVTGWTQNDSIKTWQLFQSALEENDNNQSIFELQKASALADKNNLENLEIEIKKELASRYLIVNNNYEGLRTYFQLINALTDENRFAELYEIYILLSDYYAKEKLPNNSADYRLQAMNLADSTGLYYPKGEILFEIGTLKLEALNFNEALNYLKKADKIVSKNQNNYLLIKILRNSARAYQYNGDLENAALTNQRILDLLKTTGNKKAYTRQLNNMGFIAQKMGKSKEALNYFLSTLEERQQLGMQDNENVVLLVNIGVSYQNLMQNRESKTYLERALKAAKKNKNIKLEAEIYDLLAVSYLAEDDLYNASIYNKKGLELMDGGYPYAEMDLYLTASHINERLLEYEIALDYYKKYLVIKESLHVEKLLNQEELLQQQVYVEKTEKEVQTLVAKSEIKDYQIEQLRLESKNKDIQYEKDQSEAKRKLQALQLKKTELEKARTEQELQTVKAREENQRLLLKQQELLEEQRKKEILLLENEAKISELELQRRRSINRNLIIIVFLSVLVMILAIFAVQRIRRSNKLISFEREKSDKLLLNILPKATADELKTLGQSLPRSYQSVTVLFTDFKGFTQITEKMQPESLVDSLSVFFMGFDSIMTKYGIEKIKTIGDAYMCAGGIPEPLDRAPEKVILAAQEMLKLTEKINREKRSEGLETWEIRIGVNTGPVVAGVIGSHKFQYDVWGDTVNVAARMESSGSPGKINISESTYQLVKNSFECTYRGEIEAKNKGKVKMYFIDRNASKV